MYIYTYLPLGAGKPFSLLPPAVPSLELFVIEAGQPGLGLKHLKFFKLANGGWKAYIKTWLWHWLKTGSWITTSCHAWDTAKDR